MNRLAELHVSTHSSSWQRTRKGVVLIEPSNGATSHAEAHMYSSRIDAAGSGSDPILGEHCSGC